MATIALSNHHIATSTEGECLGPLDLSRASRGSVVSSRARSCRTGKCCVTTTVTDNTYLPHESRSSLSSWTESHERYSTRFTTRRCRWATHKGANVCEIGSNGTVCLWSSKWHLVRPNDTVRVQQGRSNWTKF
jgi:hypothetical protein